MKFPLIVIEGHTVHCFRSIERAQSYMEPQDVEANEYIVYDASGHRLKLEVSWVKEKAHFLWFSWEVSRKRTFISEYDAMVEPELEFRNILVNALLRFDYSEDTLKSNSVEELVEAITHIYCR